MNDRETVEALAADFKRWGTRRVKRVQALSRKHGVLCSSVEYSNGKKG